MPRTPDESYAALNRVLAIIEAREAHMNAEIQGHIGILTKLHAQADDLRRELGIDAIDVNTAPQPHLRAVR